MTAIGGASGPGAPGGAGASTVTTPARPADDDAKKAGVQLEAFFVRRLLAEALPDGCAAMGGGFAAQTFRSMLDEALSDQVAGTGVLGLSAQFARQLGGSPELAAAPAAAPGPGAAHGALAPMAMPAALAPPHEIPHGARFAIPVAGDFRFSSRFGMRVDPIKGGTGMHPGLDLAVRQGTPVGAAADGVVTRAEPAGTYGNLVVIKHPDGLETRYAHLSAIEVRKGDQVTTGQEVGKVGATGYATGPHLHFEVRESGKPIDPRPLLDRSTTRSNR